VRDHPERQIERRRPGLGPSARTICASTPAFDCDDRTAPSRWSLNDISRNDKGRSIEIVVSGSLIANDFPTMLGAAVEGVDLVQVPEPIAAEPLRGKTCTEAGAVRTDGGAREADASPGTFALRTRPPQDDRPRTDA
jgi:hypothetical protein